MTINERLELKRAESAKAYAEHQRLWELFKAKEEERKRDYMNPRNDAYTKANKLEDEVNALEAIAKVMEAA